MGEAVKELNPITIKVDQVLRVHFKLNYDYVVVTHTTDRKVGHITISSNWGDWSYIWGAMGDDTTLPQFFAQADKEYLAHKLYGGKVKEFDSYQGQKDIKASIIRERKEGDLGKSLARELYDLADLFLDDEDCSHEYFFSQFMDDELLSTWEPSPWEHDWGMVYKSDFLALQDRIIPMIQKYFVGELDSLIELTYG